MVTAAERSAWDSVAAARRPEFRWILGPARSSDLALQQG